MKRCSRCGIEKNISQFFRNKSKADGLAVWCKPCNKDTDKTAKTRIDKWRKSEKGREWQRNFNKKRKLRYNAEQSRQYSTFESMLKRKYSIDVWTWAHKFNEQDGRCAACGDKLLFGRETSVDHDHKTNKLRDLLCRNCNLALGYVKDDLTRLQALINYLAKHANS